MYARTISFNEQRATSNEQRATGHSSVVLAYNETESNEIFRLLENNDHIGLKQPFIDLTRFCLSKARQQNRW